MRQAERRKLGLYLHIPFCRAKCLYCDFLSFGGSEYRERKRYVEALCREIEACAPIAEEYVVTTIFVGGGTPSYLESSLMETVFETIDRIFDVKEDAEITMEGNPDSLTTERLLTYRALGINRLSIGLQSANDDLLRTLGRVHNDVQFLEAFEHARTEGFSNINVDLMSGLPGENRESYIRTLEQVLRLGPEHISAYSLMVEEGTPLAQNPLLLAGLPTEEEERQQYVLTKEILQEYGYERYEISNYAKYGSVCRHNIVYWTGGEYLGLGLGASSCLVRYTDGHRRRKLRFRGTERMETYIETFYSDNGILEKDAEQAFHGKEGSAPEEAFFHFLRNTREELSFLTQEDEMEEFMFLGLRMMQGISRTEFRERFQVDLERVYGTAIRTYKENGLLLECGDRLFLSDRGIDVSNVVMADFLL